MAFLVASCVKNRRSKNALGLTGNEREVLRVHVYVHVVWWVVLSEMYLPNNIDPRLARGDC